MTERRSSADPLAGTLSPWVTRLRAEQPGDGVPGELFGGAAQRAGAQAATRAVGADTASATDLLRAAHDRIRATDGDIRAWVLLDERASDEAEALDEELRDGRSRPLHGEPIGVKDLVDVAGLPTCAGSQHWAGRGPAAADAGAVALLRSAGAVVVGKTTTHEFAFGGTTPPTRNPHDLARIPGGSSGGSAAAVAAGHVRLAVGTDTCGSVRIPASYCGTVGFLPSAGALPRDGVVPLAWSLDRVGLLAADVAALGRACAATGICGPGDDVDPGDLLRGLRLGIPRDALAEPVEPEVAAAFREAVDRLAAAGARPRTVDLPPAEAAVAAGLAIFLAESLDHHRERWTRAPELFGADVRGVLRLAEQLGAADYVRAQRVRRALRESWLSALADVDLVLTPTMPTAAPLREVAEGGVLTVGDQQVSLAEAHLRYNVVANLAALPAGTQPLLSRPGRLPVGLQWLGGPGSDDDLLRAMAAAEPILATPNV